MSRVLKEWTHRVKSPQCWQSGMLKHLLHMSRVNTQEFDACHWVDHVVSWLYPILDIPSLQLFIEGLHYSYMMCLICSISKDQDNLKVHRSLISLHNYKIRSFGIPNIANLPSFFLLAHVRRQSVLNIIPSESYYPLKFAWYEHKTQWTM